MYVEGVKGYLDLWHLWHIYHLMVWLESPESQLSKTFFQIENQLDINKVMSKNVFWVSFHTFDIHSITALTVYYELLSTSLTYIAYNPYSVFWDSFDTFDINSINYNPHSLFWASFDTFDIHSITALSTPSTYITGLTMYLSFFRHLQHT